MNKGEEITKKITCPNCGNKPVEMKRGIQDDEYGFCRKCKSLLLSGYSEMDGITVIGAQKVHLIDALLKEEGVTK